MSSRKRAHSADPPVKRTASSAENADKVLVCVLNQHADAQFAMVRYADMPVELAADVRERVRSTGCDWRYFFKNCDQVARRLMIAIGLDKPEKEDPPKCETMFADRDVPCADPPDYHKLYNTVPCTKYAGWMTTGDESQEAPNAYAACDVLMLSAHF